MRMRMLPQCRIGDLCHRIGYGAQGTALPLGRGSTQGRPTPGSSTSTHLYAALMPLLFCSAHVQGMAYGAYDTYNAAEVMNRRLKQQHNAQAVPPPVLVLPISMRALSANPTIPSGIRMKSKAKSIARKLTPIPSTLDPKVLIASKVFDP